MRFRSLFAAITIAFVSSLATWQWVNAQVPPAPQTDDWSQLAIRTGAEIGFRVQSISGNKATGRLMVKVNGRWLEAEPAVTFTPLSH